MYTIAYIMVVIGALTASYRSDHGLAAQYMTLAFVILIAEKVIDFVNRKG
jgi:hypothetical protein